jgi:hypothetical protein
VFDFLALEPTKAWSMLLWMDPFNYGGYMIYPHPEETDENGEAVVPTEMRWNVAEYLPDIVRNVCPESLSYILWKSGDLIFFLALVF